jgi:hypothetical protein
LEAAFAAAFILSHKATATNQFAFLIDELAQRLFTGSSS